MIDNIELIKPLLLFQSKDDFYYLQILQRKKENNETGSNSRIIKNYYIGSIEYLENKYEEIKSLCNLFNARAYIRLNKRSYEKVAFKALVKITDSIYNKDYISCTRSYDKAIGANHNQSNNKMWIIDIDTNDQELLKQIVLKLYTLQPVGNKFKSVIPSKNGFHIITNPFNLQEFSKFQYSVEIHKDNPTNLYIP